MGKNGLKRMYGVATSEQKWKKAHSTHISNYNQNYYQQNKDQITAQRKVSRAKSKNPFF